MRIFGHYLFEDSPELKAYKEDITKRKHEEMARACENSDRPNYLGVLLPSIPYGTIISDFPVDQEKEALKEHKELERKGECHYFNNKKYCYHRKEGHA